MVWRASAGRNAGNPPSVRAAGVAGAFAAGAPCSSGANCGAGARCMKWLATRPSSSRAMAVISSRGLRMGTGRRGQGTHCNACALHGA
ncbi:hypothetical protein G6F61_014428 [Rhizopus arrhizus]|nr:hypothetical protein G6F66_015394 [Rhizopus arrhizus]KAG1360371.1 hypothetical protein G6F61_014428 [Rhizopus arrhizus]KAG1389458.1 hypothetical protein G6F59_015538 [Rhizopus arrhizus]